MEPTQFPQTHEAIEPQDGQAVGAIDLVPLTQSSSPHPTVASTVPVDDDSRLNDEAGMWGHASDFDKLAADGLLGSLPSSPSLEELLAVYPPVSAPDDSATQSHPTGDLNPLSIFPEAGSWPVITKKPQFNAPRVSRFCHICQKQATEEFPHLACKNLLTKKCRKAVCYRCLESKSVEWFGKDFHQNAYSIADEVACPHCMGVCPLKSSCGNYRRTNMKRSLKNKQSDGSSTSKVARIDDGAAL